MMIRLRRDETGAWAIHLVLVTLSAALAACNLPLGQATIDIETPTQAITPTRQVSGVPTVDPTRATLQLAVYPPEARTGVPDLDRIIDAVLAHDFDVLQGLTHFTQLGCTHLEELGGPPICEADEAEGTIVEVVPFLGAEGHYKRRAEYESWPGPDVLGLLAVYQPSLSVFTTESFPAGEFAIIFLDRSGVSDLTLQVSQGKVVRFDYGTPGSVESQLARDAADVLMPLSFNPIPTAVPWNRFDEARFSFLYPPTMTILEQPGEAIWRLGEQMEIFIRRPGDSWIACFDQALGDCPVVEEDGQVEINGMAVRRVKGWFGAVGFGTPQEFLTYIFPLAEEQLVFTVYALPFGTGLQEITQVWPLEGVALDLFERAVSTVELLK